MSFILDLFDHLSILQHLLVVCPPCTSSGDSVRLVNAQKRWWLNRFELLKTQSDRTQNGNAYKSIVCFRKRPQDSSSIKVRKCATAKGCLTIRSGKVSCKLLLSSLGSGTTCACTEPLGAETVFMQTIQIYTKIPNVCSHLRGLCSFKPRADPSNNTGTNFFILYNSFPPSSITICTFFLFLLF